MSKAARKDKRDESVRAILDAAMEVFAEVGYEGARIDEIARRAGINKAMLYYRIGDKKMLYEAVIHDVYGDTAERLEEEIRAESSPEEKFRTLVAGIAGTLSNHPHFSRIMMREAVSGWTNFGEVIIRDISGMLKITGEIIDDGVQQGLFIESNPLMIHMMTIGTLLLYDLAIPMKDYFESVLGDNVIPPGKITLDDVVPTVQSTMLRALKA